jgi:hypothetical protein
MRTYEERKAESVKKADETGGRKPASMPEDAGEPASRAADGMMAGVVPGAVKSEIQKKLLPVTALGRYMKVLLSSNEFLFVE